MAQKSKKEQLIEQLLQEERIKNQKKSSHDGMFGGLAIICGIIYILFKVICSLGYNVLNVSNLFNFGISFYGNNIITMHAPSYIITEKNKYIYHTIPKIQDLNDTNNIILTVKKNQILKNHGYITQTGSSWVAVSFYLNDEERTGYMYIPSKIGYDIFKINNISGHFSGEVRVKNKKTLVKIKIEEIKTNQRKKFLDDVSKNKLDIVYIKNETDLQKFEESEQYKEYVRAKKYGLESHFATFINKKDLKILKELNKKYFSDKLLITIKNSP